MMMAASSIEELWKMLRSGGGTNFSKMSQKSADFSSCLLKNMPSAGVIKMSKKHTIHAFFHTQTEGMLNVLKELGTDVTKCCICGGPIVKTERAPTNFTEKWDAWRHKKKFYDWNISAIHSTGVCCEEIACYMQLLEQQREIEIKKQIEEMKSERV